MRLNLKDIILVPGASKPFDFSMDLSELEFHGEKPITKPVQVTGEVRNRGGALTLTAEAVTVLSLTCDRCGKAFEREKVTSFESLLATELEQEEHDDEIVPLEGDELDVGTLMRDAFILDLDAKNLCTEDCKGLCSGCGVDLNAEPCRCKKETDPRLAALAQFLQQNQ